MAIALSDSPLRFSEAFTDALDSLDEDDFEAAMEQEQRFDVD